MLSLFLVVFLLLASLLQHGVCLSIFDLSEVGWTLHNESSTLTINASIPSVAHLDLLRSGYIENPLYGTNDATQLWIALNNWTYTSAPLTYLTRKNDTSTYLVFNGIDTFADIFICNSYVGTTNNQFRQFVFDISHIMSHCAFPPRLRVALTSAPVMARVSAAELLCQYCLNVPYRFSDRQYIRKEQSDFGWDWSPAFAPQGIWQPAFVVQISPEQATEVYVKNSLIDIYRKGQVNNLPPDQTMPWIVNISMDYLGSRPLVGSMLIEVLDANHHPFTNQSISDVHVTNTTIQASTEILKSPELWWPAGRGEQPLYWIKVHVLSPHGTVLASISKRTGFRTIVLNQMPITQKQMDKGIAPGANWHFEINGEEIFCKGSNLVPLGVFWPNVTEDQTNALFESAIAGNQNMLRVWASGVYVPDFVYDLADEMGIMLWSEFQFSDALYPVEADFLANIQEEAYYQTRRINHHPSLALWAGNNEIQLALLLIADFDPSELDGSMVLFEDLFLDIILHVVFDNSRSISYSPSSVTNGYISLNHSAAMPIIERYNTSTGNSIYGNTDYYNYDITQTFNLSSYPIGRFATEFGFLSHASYDTYANYIHPDELSFNSSTMRHRNRHYPIPLEDLVFPSEAQKLQNTTYQDQLSLLGLGNMAQGATANYPTPHKTSQAEQFRAEIYATQLFAAEFVRSQIEFYRWGSSQPQRNMGSLYWMLNDVWAAPTWSSIDADQRWKALHYLSRSTYEPVIIHPNLVPLSSNVSSQHLTVWVTSDLWEVATGQATIEWFDWRGSSLHSTPSVSVQIEPINSTLVASIDLTQDLPFDTAKAVAFLKVNVTSTAASNRSKNRSRSGDGETIYTATRPYHVHPLSSTIIPNPKLNVTFNENTDTFTVTSQTLAAWVWLEHPSGIQGYWDDNAFWMLPGTKEIRFVSQNTTVAQSIASWAQKVTVRSIWDLTQA